MTFSSRLYAYLQVMRPANIVTAFADIIAGFTAAGGIMAWQAGSLAVTPDGLGWLLTATFGLYGGGVVFNDYFDAELDARERPERPIPSGRVSKRGVALLGSVLLLLGIAAAAMVNPYSIVLALLIAGGSLLYDRTAKHHKTGGPLLMGLLRGWNLMLGCSVVPVTLLIDWYLPLLPIAYIGSITLISRGEVHGGTRRSGLLALGLVLLVSGGLMLLGLQPHFQLMTALPFIIIFAASVLPPFLKAALTPSPEFIRQAVVRGVICLILLNSALAAGFGGFIPALIVTLLLPVSLLLSRFFSVT